MRRSLVQAAIIVVMAICVSIPVLEIISHYHNSFLSGHDTVATLIVVALCSAVAVPVVKAIFALYSKLLALELCVIPTPRCLPTLLDLEVPLSGHPPPILRI